MCKSNLSVLLRLLYPCRPNAYLPLELMMQVAACMDTDANMRALRAVNKQWKAAVDESVTRCASLPVYLVQTPFLA
jgi:hypothetical protein